MQFDLWTEEAAGSNTAVLKVHPKRFQGPGGSDGGLGGGGGG